MKKPILIALCFATDLGCVTTAKYDAAVAELNATLAEHDRLAAERAEALSKAAGELRAKVASLEMKLGETSDLLVQTAADRDHVAKQLDDAMALEGAMKARLEQLGQNMDKLAGERGQLMRGLADARAGLEELRQRKAAAEAEARLYRMLVDRFKTMIDSGQLKVTVRDGRMLVELPNDVLFDTGKTEIKPDARRTLADVAEVLAEVKGRDFLVAGHTDDVPIHNARFASNWELSSGRALQVTHFLIGHGLAPAVLAAAGYGEFHPVMPNDTPAHRQLNRRIEIVLQPNLSELPTLDTRSLLSHR
ncbi:MAG TPA: OmpA family protein [Myxococcales bacterium]|nr:OmpA family protein [Myxococcales bacterium]